LISSECISYTFFLFLGSRSFSRSPIS
jgi:hypothetical protein